MSSSAGADLGTGAAGSSSDAARADHVHDMPTFHEITNGTATTSGNLTLDPATGSVIVQGGQSTEGSVTLNCQQNTHGVKIQSPPHSAAASYTLTLPSTAGSQGQVMTTSGAGGVLSWSTLASSGITFVDAPTSSDSPGSTGDLSFDDNYFYVKTASGWRRASLIGWGISIVITSHPSSSTAAIGSSVTLSAAAQTSNGGPVNYQWQSSSTGSDFAAITGAESSSYTVTVSSGTTDITYRCMIFASGATTAFTDTATISLEAAGANLLLIESGDHLHTEAGDGLLHSGPGSSITITQQPTDQTLSGTSLTMSVVATNSGSGLLSYQWQESQNGGVAWYSITQGTQANFTIASQVVRDGFKYRVIVTAPGSAEVISNVITTTIPSTAINALITNVSHLGDAGNDVDCMVMSNDGSTIVAYRTITEDIVIYRQFDDVFAQEDTISINASNDSGSALSTTKNAQLSVSNDGDVFAICMPDAADHYNDPNSSYGDLPMPLGRVRVYERDSSGDWSQRGSDIDGTLNDNGIYAYGGDYLTSPLSDVAINQDGSKMFILTAGDASRGIKGRIDIYEYSSQYGWSKEVTVTATGSTYSPTSHYWQAVQCNDDGTTVSYVEIGASSTTTNVSILTTHDLYGSTWENASYPTYATNYTHDEPSSDTYHRAGRYRYQFSRDLKTVVMSNLLHDEAQVNDVGLIILANRGSVSASFTDAAELLGPSAGSRVFAVDVSADGDDVLVWQNIDNTAKIGRYYKSGTTLAARTSTQLAATAAAINGAGTRIAYWQNATDTLRVIE